MLPLMMSLLVCLMAPHHGAADSVINNTALIDLLTARLQKLESKVEKIHPTVDCAMGPWSSFGPCSSSCNGGQQIRSRKVATQPQNGGNPCQTTLTDNKQCNMQPCTSGTATTSMNSAKSDKISTSTPASTFTPTSAISFNSTMPTTVLWLGPDRGTLNLPDMSPVTSDCEITNPHYLDRSESQSQMINGKLYSCNHEKCQIYDEETKSWTIIHGMKFNTKRKQTAGTILDNNQWLVQGGNDNYKDVDTAEMWSPGQGNWQFSTTYKSPLPVYSHCLVNTQGGVMQIGGYSYARVGRGRTNRCFLNQKEVQGLKKGRFAHACILHDGQIFVAGGSVSHGSAKNVEVYNIQTGQWSDGPSLPITGSDLRPQLVEIDSKLHYIGGDRHDKIYRLDDGTNTWNYVTDVKTGYKYSAAIIKKSCK